MEASCRQRFQPTYLGALVMATPKVKAMGASAVRAGLLVDGQMEAKLEDRVRNAELAFLRSLDELERVKAEDFLGRVKAAASEQWQDVVMGRSSNRVRAPGADATYSSPNELTHSSPGLLPEDDDAPDIEAPGRKLTAPHVQKELAKLQDCTRLRALEHTLPEQSSWAQLDRLRELRHRSHTSGCGILMHAMTQSRQRQIMSHACKRGLEPECMWEKRSAESAAPCWTPTLSTPRRARRQRPHEVTMLACVLLLKVSG